MSKQKYDTFENEETGSPSRAESTVSVRIDDPPITPVPTIEQYRPSLSCDARFQLLIGLGQIAFEVISSLIDWVVYGTVDSSDDHGMIRTFLAITIVGMFILVAQVTYIVLYYFWQRDIRLDIVSLISICFKLLPQVAVIFFIEAVQQTDHYNPSQLVRVIHAVVDVIGRIIIFVIFLYRQYTRYEKRALNEHSTIIPMFALHIVISIIIITLAILIFGNN